MHNHSAMTKAKLIAELLDCEVGLVEDILELRTKDTQRLVAQLKDQRHHAEGLYRAWGNRRCPDPSCRKLNKNCGEIMHQISTLESWPTAFATFPKTRAPGTTHAWMEE